MRYIIYCVEAGYPISNPYCEDDDKDVAEIVCKTMAQSSKCRWFIFDRVKDKDVFMVDGNMK